MGAAAQGDRARRRAGATALTAAVIGGLLGGVPTAQAAPLPGPGEHSAGAADQERDGTKARGSSVPPVWPRPQSMREQGSFVPVGRDVTLVADEDTDAPALETLRAALRRAGARDIAEVRPGQPLPHRNGLVVRADAASAATALRALHAPPRGDLPRGGYRLAVGRTDSRDTVALEGADADGLFHAAQTLRQLVSEEDGSRGFAGVTVRDWPTAPVRGITEGFYGGSWTHQERLEQLDFLGRTKQNRYLYASTDDPYRQSSHWRDPYPAAQRGEFRALAERARRNHVKLGWAVAPGQGMCFSSPADRRALLRKLDSMRALGFEAFQLRFEDVSYSEWHCDEDAQAYGTGPKAAARAHAELAGDVARHLSARHPDAEPLSVMPTEFYQDGDTDYRTELSKTLNPGVEVAWTGVGVVPRTITGGELTAARSAFHQHPLVTMDNYPVNDYAQDRIFLGPYRGREPAVAARSAAVLSNAMKQPTASRIPLFTAADYAWNPKSYSPEESWQAAISEVAGSSVRSREAVGALAGNDASSLLGGKESAYLRPMLEDFWNAYDAADPEDDASMKQLRRSADRLRGEFRAMRTAREHVPGSLAREVRPWLDELARHGEAGEHAVRMLTAQSRGDGGSAWDARLAAERLHAKDPDGRKGAEASATVGKGVLSDFVKRALKASDSWTGADHAPSGRHRATAQGGPTARPDSPAEAAVDGDPDTAYRAEAAPATGWFAPRDALPGASLPGGLTQRGAPGGGPSGGPGRGPGESGPGTPALTVRLPERRPLEAVTVQTGPGSGTRARVEAHVPGEGWRRLGPLSGSGWTQRDARGLRADALRLAWSPGSDEPVVHEITPWYADQPDASLSLSKDDIDASIGGGKAELTAELHGHRPSDLHGRITAEAPRGFTVRTPERTVVPRGGTAKVPVEIEADSSVEPGKHRIRLSFGDENRTLTVRAFPRAGGPDLARDAEASSSGDETGEFPASAVNDGRKDTRWSSPAKDGEWVQLKLRRPVRLGELVLHWQDAYAKRYRVQVSPDGKRWRDAATVREGMGGRETVRMDAPGDTRYVRVQGDERATRFGYSLWALQAYAVLGGPARDR
ncbi:hyaluronidase [Streptomyces bathyalis]|uniref:Hyaluronidase n=1 Tax=Streptomyces bathyalis TaxID=2710756 RepID=A0A7T1T9E5_9ACTN|nr:beta-N-acetylglucosaminidase domain-containing protein [Streptomyces bathyalis]QPP08836.1 hyaluronidase [Streptomyces bathyalis]